jgi:hypothetical protein
VPTFLCNSSTKSNPRTRSAFDRQGFASAVLEVRTPLWLFGGNPEEYATARPSSPFCLSDSLGNYRKYGVRFAYF